MGPLQLVEYAPTVKDPEQLVITDFIYDDVKATLSVVSRAIKTIRKKKGWASKDPILVELKDIRATLQPFLTEKKRSALTRDEVISLNKYTADVRCRFAPMTTITSVTKTTIPNTLTDIF